MYSIFSGQRKRMRGEGFKIPALGNRKSKQGGAAHHDLDDYRYFIDFMASWSYF